MANRTQKGVHQVKGTNPQYLVEKIIRSRIYDSRYWKEECFALTAEGIVVKGTELRFLGGVHGGNIQVTPFLCLTLKMLQIQPDKDITIEFIRQEDFKYLRALGAMYLRLTGSSVECYKYLEPIFNDFRKLRWMNKMGQFELTHMDEFIDKLLHDERVCDIQLPRLQKREILVESGELKPYKSALEEDIEAMEDSSDEDKEKVTRKQITKLDEEAQKADIERRKEIEKKKREKQIAADIAAGMHADEARKKDKEKHRRTDKDDKKKKEKKKEKERKEKLRETSEERDIREQNELRAKLGLAPLK